MVQVADLFMYRGPKEQNKKLLLASLSNLCSKCATVAGNYVKIVTLLPSKYSCVYKAQYQKSTSAICEIKIRLIFRIIPGNI